MTREVNNCTHLMNVKIPVVLIIKRPKRYNVNQINISVCNNLQVVKRDINRIAFEELNWIKEYILVMFFFSIQTSHFLSIILRNQKSRYYRTVKKKRIPNFIHELIPSKSCISSYDLHLSCLMTLVKTINEKWKLLCEYNPQGSIYNQFTNP